MIAVVIAVVDVGVGVLSSASSSASLLLIVVVVVVVVAAVCLCYIVCRLLLLSVISGCFDRFMPGQGETTCGHARVRFDRGQRVDTYGVSVSECYCCCCMLLMLLLLLLLLACRYIWSVSKSISILYQFLVCWFVGCLLTNHWS